MSVVTNKPPVEQDLNTESAASRSPVRPPAGRSAPSSLKILTLTPRQKRGTDEPFELTWNL